MRSCTFFVAKVHLQRPVFVFGILPVWNHPTPLADAGQGRFPGAWTLCACPFARGTSRELISEPRNHARALTSSLLQRSGPRLCPWRMDTRKGSKRRGIALDRHSDQA